MPLLLPIVLTLIAGIGLAVQPPVNAALARSAGSTLLAALVSFAVGTVVLALLWAAFDRTSPALLRDAPRWAWTGGLYGVAFVSIAAFAAPRLGIASMLTIAIASQLAAALIIDHFGLLQMPRVEMSVARLAGVALVLAGVVLVRRG